MTPEELKAWRKSHGGLEKAAKIAGVHLRTWTRWERGESPVPHWLPTVLEATERKQK